jgi:hypothetical protein
MTTNNLASKTNKINDKRVILSTLWIFVTVNYLYCDIIALMDSPLLKQFLTGNVGGMKISEGFLFGAAILMEIPMASIILSRVLKYNANRWANIIAGIIMTVVQFSSLFVGKSPTLYYIFFSIMEISSTALIVWLAWKWTNQESGNKN